MCYGDKQVLHDLSFTAKAGTVTAIVGPSGSGKSTLAAAIAGLEQARGGNITIGGVPLSDFAPGELAKVISVVYQSPFVFSGTVRENICRGLASPSEEAMRAAAAMVQCDTLVDSFPDGYDTRIGAGGTIHLSGGQRQRIAIARAILKDAPLLILDEATASIDPENELLIQQGLNNLTREKTLLVIAHRLSTIQKAHQILVLKDEAIAERGAHDELLARNGLYAHLWQRQNELRSWTLT